jgi:hypothetical protein
MERLCGEQPPEFIWSITSLTRRVRRNPPAHILRAPGPQPADPRLATFVCLLAGPLCPGTLFPDTLWPDGGDVLCIGPWKGVNRASN